MAAANKLATTPRPFRPEEAAGEGRLEDFPRSAYGCGGPQCTEPASLTLPFRFELVEVAA